MRKKSMENFIVSARKYRPETFTAVVGQQSITATLKNAIKSNHLGHAYLFCGPRGIGKTTCARIFAKTINCTGLAEDFEPCNKCESCTSFNENRAYNIHELDAASNNSVEDIRNLTEQVRIPPQIGKYSVYIIDEVHMLSSQAFNAFLKTLEEPPAHAIFILATTEKHKIIPTILSRCQIFDFNRIRIQDIVGYLEYISREEKIEYEPDAFNIIAQKADGAMRDALSIYDQIVSFSGNRILYKNVIENLNILDYEFYFRLVDAFLQGNVGDTLLILNEILENGFDSHHFLIGLSNHFRDLLVCKDPVTLQLLEVGAGIRERYQLQSQQTGMEFLLKSLDILGNADIHYRASRNQRLHVELCLLKLCELPPPDKKKALTGTDQDGDKIKAVSKGNESAEENAATPERTTGLFEHQQERSEVPVKKIPFASSIHSIKDALNGVEKKENDLQADDETLLDQIQNRKFSEAELMEKWNEYAEKIRTDKPRMYSTLVNHKPVLQEDQEIIIVLSNSAQMEDFNRNMKPDILSYLGKSLGNTLIRISPVIAEGDDKRNVLYTAEDKFDHMSKKNPNLARLRQRFSLDFE